MTQIAVEKCYAKRVAVPKPAQGSTFFGAMAALWGGFVTLLAVSPTTLDDAYGWLRGLPIVWELLMWIVTLPWTVAYLAYESNWQHWVRVLVVALVVTADLRVCAPRARRSSALAKHAGDVRDEERRDPPDEDEQPTSLSSHRPIEEEAWTPGRHIPSVSKVRSSPS